VYGFKSGLAFFIIEYIGPESVNQAAGATVSRWMVVGTVEEMRRKQAF
jgi:hypothetical protein